MELKNYQKQEPADLTLYLDCLNETQSLPDAYRNFWREKEISVGFGGVPAYQNTLSGVPSICAKVPTGGGKTLLACHSIRLVIDGLPSTKTKVVVWLVSSGKSAHGLCGKDSGKN